VAEQLAMTTSAAPGHELTLQATELGGDRCFFSTCSCGHRSAPSLSEKETAHCADLHVRSKDGCGYWSEDQGEGR
jgi:hypothetical protein